MRLAALCLAAAAGGWRGVAAAELVAARSAVIVDPTSRAETVGNVVDGDTTTFWQSGGCWPSGWVDRPQSNALLGACGAGLCQASGEDGVAPAQNLWEVATDGNMAYTNIHVPALQSVSAA